VAAILAMTGFDTSGMRGAAPLLRKDVDIVLDVARSRDAAQPDALVSLAERTLSTLTAPDQAG
jgi:hypothetical protein